MELIFKLALIIGAIAEILWFLGIFGLDKKLKKLFKIEEKPLNNEQELAKIKTEINRSKTKEEKEIIEDAAIKSLSDVELIRAIAQLKPKRSDKKLFKKLEQNK